VKITKMLKQRASCLFLGLAFWLAPEATANTFTDGFEGDLSFWTVTGPGTAILTNAIAHTGSHSAQLTTSSTFPWSVSLSHDFGSQETGSVSVYVRSQLSSGASADLEIFQNNGGWANIQQLGTGGFQTRVCSSPSSSAPLCQSGVFFSGSNLNWHQFEIGTGSNGVTVKLDGITAVTDPSITGFRAVNLDVWGAPSAGSAYYDDFTAITAVVPEPATVVMLALGIGVILGLNCHHRSLSLVGETGGPGTRSGGRNTPPASSPKIGCAG
jgi:hypothetical protein